MSKETKGRGKGTLAACLLSCEQVESRVSCRWMSARAAACCTDGEAICRNARRSGPCQWHGPVRWTGFMFVRESVRQPVSLRAVKLDWPNVPRWAVGDLQSPVPAVCAPIYKKAILFLAAAHKIQDVTSTSKKRLLLQKFLFSSQNSFSPHFTNSNRRSNAK